VDEALARILARITPLEPAEAPLLESIGSVLAEDAIADRDVPAFRNSAMDGYAVRAADVAQSGVRLEVLGSGAAGRMPARVGGAVVRRPHVAIVSTGDELVDVAQEPGPGQIRDANRYSLAAAVRALGCPAFELGIVRDEAADLKHALGNAAFGDLVLTSGGVSVGDHDHVKPVVDAMGSMDFWSIAIRPGRPLAFGELRTKRGAVPIFGLPGNPVSALLTFELFVRPALLRMAGHTKLQRPRATAKLQGRIEKPSGLRMFA